ncbi:MAG: fumarate hydratase, partial [Sulfolobales archaeon]
LRKLAESSYALITAISPLIGYDRASELVKQLREGKDLRTVLKDLGFSDEEVSRLLDVNKMLRPQILKKTK